MREQSRAGSVVVAIPVRDEEERLRACLEAIDNQAGARADHIVLLLNNCSDGSAAVARRLQPSMRAKVSVIEVRLADARANAGHARRIAMGEAARMAGAAGIVMTTDADGRVDPDWVATNLAAFRAGADAVAGWAELDPLDWGSIPVSLHEDDARERAYDETCDEIHALLDPDPADPFPRHTQASGASLAVTVSALLAAGGVPDVPSGEDRALVAALRRIDARVRHAPECRVMVSGRTIGRAVGGMADTIRRRLEAPDLFLDVRLEPAADCARRAALRCLARRVHIGQGDADLLANALDVGFDRLMPLLRPPTFGAAWEGLQSTPTLRRSCVSVRDLASEQRSAEAIRSRARRDPDACRLDLIASAVTRIPHRGGTIL